LPWLGRPALRYMCIREQWNRGFLRVTVLCCCRASALCCSALRSGVSLARLRRVRTARGRSLQGAWETGSGRGKGYGKAMEGAREEAYSGRGDGEVELRVRGAEASQRAREAVGSVCR